jgi:hypothetical protein
MLAVEFGLATRSHTSRERRNAVRGRFGIELQRASPAFLSSSARCASSAALASASITGPTSVVSKSRDRRRRAPASRRRSSPAWCRRHRPGRTARASAEQRWPALWKAEAMTSRVTCSGSADESTIIAFCPPVSAISGMIGPSRSASVRLMARAVSVEPVKATPAISGCAVSAAPTCRRRARAGRRPRNARLVHQLDRERADQRRLLGRLGDRGIARGERGGDRADEDREREIPRADAGEHAAAVEAELVLLAGRSRERHRGGELAPRFGRVIAQEIDRLAHFEHRVGKVLPASRMHSEKNSSRCARTGRRRGRAAGAGLAAERSHSMLRGMRGANHAVDVGGVARRRADGRAGCRTARRSARAQRLAAEVGRRSSCGFRARQPLEQRLAHQRIAEIDAGAVARALPKIALGSGIAGLRLGSSASSSATGSRTRASTGTSSSAMRLTKRSWRRFRAGAGRDRRAAPCGCRPARRCAPASASRRSRARAWRAPRTAPRPCRGGAGTRTASCRPAP